METKPWAWYSPLSARIATRRTKAPRGTSRLCRFPRKGLKTSYSTAAFEFVFSAVKQLKWVSTDQSCLHTTVTHHRTNDRSFESFNRNSKDLSHSSKLEGSGRSSLPCPASRTVNRQCRTHVVIMRTSGLL